MPRIVDKDAKRADLVEAAATVFAREGFSGTKMAHVAEEAGVGKGTLYEYFASKDELFLAVCQQCVRWPESAAPFVENPSRGLRHLVFALLESYERATGFFSILVDYWSVVIRERGEHGQLFLTRGVHFYERPLALLGEVIRVGQAKGDFRDDADPCVTARIIIAGIEGLRLQRAISPPGFSLEDSVSAFAEMILHNLAPGTRASGPGRS